MIRSIRGRLQWWYGAVYALSIIVFGCLVYWRADRDVHERATLHAVSTAQYLDVSLRTGRPGPMRDGRPGNPPDFNPRDDQTADHFPPDFGMGPLPPEFQFRPPRDRYPEMGPPHDPRPEPLRGPDQQNGPPGRRGPVGPRLPLESPGENNDGPRPPIDRMEFVIWRPDGSVLAQSDFTESNKSPELHMPIVIGHQPQITRGNGFIEAAMHGPQQATILVRRPLRHDIAKLHRFGFQIAAMAVGTLAVGILGGWWISGRMVQPIQMISETAAQISAANLDRRIDTKDLDQELVQLGSVLNGTFERLETSFQRLTQFTADASHELRTPLAVIQSQAELALSQPRSAEAYQQTLETCLKSAERMRSLVDGLLLLARTDSDHSELRKVTIDLRKVAEDAVAQLQDKATSAGIDLECAAPETIVGVSADIRFLMQVPINLIDNAIQHTPSGGKISVEVKTDGNDAVLSVHDGGCGISAEHLPQLFERFYRVDNGRSRQHGGSGLGLSICKSLVEAHGGTIQCTSMVGEGSMFVVRLPLVYHKLQTILILFLLWSQSVCADDAINPSLLTHLAGHWYVTKAEPAVYYYKDAERYLDLFSYHCKVSNEDGIDNLKVGHDTTHIIIDSQGYPNHPTAVFPNSGNPNSIKVQSFRFKLPLEPRLNDHITRVPMGPIGLALNGVVFFNPFEAGGMNAVEGYSEVWLDSCCGHPEQRGVYHYHKYPVCVKSPFRDSGKEHSPVIGFAFDGFPVYGPYESNKVMAKDLPGGNALDVCNGHSDDIRGYHYHATPGRFPYILGGYAGVPDPANIRGPRRSEEGAIEDNSEGESRQPQVIASIQPGNVSPGKKRKLTIELAPEKANRVPVPDGKPDWVQIGPFEALSVERDGNLVHVEIDIPVDAAVGVLMDCHMEFKPENRPRVVFKTNELFRVVDDEEP